MPVITKEQKDNLPVHRRISWREYYNDITRTRMYPNFQREMLLNHVGADGEIEYQGVAIYHVINEGDKKEPNFRKYEVIYDEEFVAEILFDQFSDLGMISNGKVNEKLWAKWLNPDEGKIATYASTEGLRKQEAEDRMRAQQLVESVGQTIEFWMESFKRARENGEAQEKEAPTKSNGSASAKKTAKV